MNGIKIYVAGMQISKLSEQIEEKGRKKMKSDNVKVGMQQAPHRSLFNALGMTEEEIQYVIDKINEFK